MTLGPTTELNAINRMLHILGESPVSSLASLPDDGLTARRLLEDVTREVLTQGWHFNTDYDFPLTADAMSPYAITVPSSAVKVDLCRGSDFDMVIRGKRLYDRRKKTFSFPGATVRANITWLFPFDECPEALRQYLWIKAARLFSAGSMPSELTYQLTQEDEQRALIEWEAADGRQADHNVLRDNWTTRAILNREA